MPCGHDEWIRSVDVDDRFSHLSVATSAQTYADFAGILAGFAFTGLCVYLERRNEPGESANGIAEVIRRIRSDHVAATILFAMFSLAMSTFVYANLAGEAQSYAPNPKTQNLTIPPGSAVAALLPYGVIFGLSVLTLVYAVTLMMFESPATRPAAKYAFWAVAIAGPLVVLRFLAAAARNIWEMNCALHHKCSGTPWLLSTGHIAIMLLLILAISLVVTWTGVLHMEPLRPFRDRVAKRPTVPAIGVFVLTVATTVWGSLFLNTRERSYAPPAWLIYSSLVVGVAFVIFFSLTCGCVVYDRKDADKRSVDIKQVIVDTLYAVFAYLEIRDEHKAAGESIKLEHDSGARPSKRFNDLIWELPAHNELISRIRLAHTPDIMRLGGQLAIVVDDPSATKKVIVEWEIRDQHRTPLMTGKITACKGTGLGSSLPGTPILELVLRRIDRSPASIRLRWHGPWVMAAAARIITPVVHVHSLKGATHTNDRLTPPKPVSERSEHER